VAQVSERKLDMENTWIGFWSLNGKVHQSLYVLFSYFEKESVDDWGSRRGIKRYKEPIPNRCPLQTSDFYFLPLF
jgi:hypothetical protein